MTTNEAIGLLLPETAPFHATSAVKIAAVVRDHWSAARAQI
jgi:hypothetical protein